MHTFDINKYFTLKVSNYKKWLNNKSIINNLIPDALGTDEGSSWRSETPDDPTQSPAPSSCATPNSSTELPESELSYTVGTTEATPYACPFCEKAFPRLSYLKKHEQVLNYYMLYTLYAIRYTLYAIDYSTIGLNITYTNTYILYYTISFVTSLL